MQSGNAVDRFTKNVAKRQFNIDIQVFIIERAHRCQMRESPLKPSAITNKLLSNNAIMFLRVVRWCSRISRTLTGIINAIINTNCLRIDYNKPSVIWSRCHVESDFFVRFLQNTFSGGEIVPNFSRQTASRRAPSAQNGTPFETIFEILFIFWDDAQTKKLNVFNSARNHLKRSPIIESYFNALLAFEVGTDLFWKMLSGLQKFDICRFSQFS